MPHNLQFSLCLSVFQMEGAYLSFLWIRPEVVGSVVWSQACECVTKSLYHLLKGLLLCGNAQTIGVQETPCVGMNRLAICTYMLNNRGARTLPFGRPFFCLRHLMRLPTRSTKKRPFDNMFWISSVSLTSCVISKNFPVRIPWFTDTVRPRLRRGRQRPSRSASSVRLRVDLPRTHLQ